MAHNKYEMNNDPAVEEARKPKDYRVSDDAGISNAGFSNIVGEEQRLIAEVEKYSEKTTFGAILLSVIHCHYFYVGRMGRGLLCLFTANFLYIGFLIDLFLIISGKFKDKNGKPVNSPSRTRAELELREFYKKQAR